MYPNVTIQNDKVGTIVYDKKTKTNTFVPHGNAVYLDDIYENIENGEVTWLLCCNYQGKTKSLKVERENINDSATMRKLAAQGVNIFKNNDILLKSIYNQEEQRNGLPNHGVTDVYTNLGWIYLRDQDDEGNEIINLAYRAHQLLIQGCENNVGEYLGNYKIAPHGSFDVWRKMVIDDVVGSGAMELLLLAGLSAIINGLIGTSTTGENPIFHLYFLTTKGKSTCGFLISSISCKPFDGVESSYDNYGIAKKYRSLYQSWGATENAIITRQQGNMGMPVVLNEINKYKGKNISQLVYDLSEGTDKARLTQNLECNLSDGYATSFISFGEISLLEQCESKNGGEDIRVLELEEPLTTSAKQADHIKAVSRENYAWAGPMLAKYILDNGGYEYVKEIYDSYCEMLTTTLTDPLQIRFTNKFTALIMTTAMIAREALNINFDTTSVKDMLDKYMLSTKSTEVKAKASYERVIEELEKNINNFYGNPNGKPYHDIWGKVDYPNEKQGDKIITTEFSVRSSTIKDVLNSLGYQNLKSELEKWEQLGVLFTDPGHKTRKRIIVPKSKNQERVYVLRVMEDADNDTLNT